MLNESLGVNARRLQQTIEELALIGGTAHGGMRRLALTNEDKAARELLMQWLSELDLEVTVDDMGNMFGTLPGRDNSLAPVMSGSHLDTQPMGGRFDGVLGVTGALEVIRTLKDRDIRPERPITLVNWTNEEGSRFAPTMVGSGVWTGFLDKEWVYNRTDFDGARFVDELERIGFKGTVPAAKWPVHSYFEYHIEQGPLLEREGKLIGAPRGIVGMRWMDIIVGGTANQVGPTPMKGRNDALCAAAEMILAVNAIPLKKGGDLVATVGEIHNFPNSRNIIPDKVHFTVDMRSWHDDLCAQAWKELDQTFRLIAESRGCSVSIEETWGIQHAPFDQTLIDNIARAADALGYPTLSMVSGAGHDASYMSRIAPTAMIFVPSVGGRSHVEVEYTLWEDCAAGANVLLRVILQSALEL